ncbi:hypothetical protein B0H14DRAFT_3127303, partial [Mycena olivaceomarginata]
MYTWQFQAAVYHTPDSILLLSTFPLFIENWNHYHHHQCLYQLHRGDWLLMCYWTSRGFEPQCSGLSAKPIIDLVKKLRSSRCFSQRLYHLPQSEEDDIPCRIFELEVEDGTVASTFNHRVDILFGEHVRDSDGRLKYVRRGNLGMDCVVKYLESIHWESAKIPFDLARGKLARIADELGYL